MTDSIKRKEKLSEVRAFRLTPGDALRMVDLALRLGVRESDLARQAALRGLEIIEREACAANQNEDA